MLPNVTTRFFIGVWLLVGSAQPASAQSQAEFEQRIDAAFRAEEKPKALRSLFFLDGVDPEIIEMYETRIIGRMLGSLGMPEIGFEPLPADFRGDYVSNGYEYRPNLDLEGYVVFDGNTRAPYGAREGRFYLSGMNRALVNADAPPDVMLQAIVIGMASPAMTFEGHCDFLESNGKTRRVELRDNGHGNRTVLANGQRIEGCVVTRTSEGGALSLRLLEGDAEIFEKRVTAPEKSIRFTR